jgi:hypothetical protein
MRLVCNEVSKFWLLTLYPHQALKIRPIRDPGEKNSSAWVQRLSGNRFCNVKAAGNGKDAMPSPKSSFVPEAADSGRETVGNLLGSDEERKLEEPPLLLFTGNVCKSVMGVLRPPLL